MTRRIGLILISWRSGRRWKFLRVRVDWTVVPEHLSTFLPWNSTLIVIVLTSSNSFSSSLVFFFFFVFFVVFSVFFVFFVVLFLSRCASCRLIACQFTSCKTLTNFLFVTTSLQFVMTCKMLHYYVQKGGGYSKGQDLGQLVALHKTKLWIQDFCALYMHLLKGPRYAPRLLQWRLAVGAFAGFCASCCMLLCFVLNFTLFLTDAMRERIARGNPWRTGRRGPLAERCS
jgi:hypothetical protein